MTGWLIFSGGQEFVNDWFSAIERQNQVRVVKQLGFSVENYSSDFLIDLFSCYLEDLYKMDNPHFVFDLLQNSLLTHVSAFIAKILRVNEQNEKLLINTELSHQFTSVLRWKIFEYFLLDNRKHKRTPSKGQLISFYEKNSLCFEGDFFKLTNHFYFWIHRRSINAE